MAKASTDPVVIEWAKAQPTAVWAGTPADPLGARRTAVDLEWTVDAYLALGARRVAIISPTASPIGLVDG